MNPAISTIFVLICFASVASPQNVIRFEPGESPLPAGLLNAPILGSSISLALTGNMPDDPIGLLQRKQIQEELKLTDGQITIVQELKNDIQRQTSEFFRTQAKFGGDAAGMMESATKAVRENIEKELTEVLDHKQLKRLRQLEVQMKIKNRGALALVDDRLAASLEISDEQKADIKSQQRDSQAELAKEIERLRENYRDELIKELLSKNQLRILEELSGDDYDVQPIDFRRRNHQLQ